MKRSVVFGLVLALLISGLACGLLPTRGRSSAGDMEIRVINNSPDAICYVLISPSDDDSWGDDWLGNTDVIEPGDNRVFTLEHDTVDLKVETCNEETMATLWEIDRDTTVTVGELGAVVRLVLLNDSSADICFVHISPPSADEWGEDWLGAGEGIYPGGRRIFYVRADWYDLQASDCDGTVLIEEFDVDLSDDLEWTVGN